ncbi:MAG: MarR family transcriptional regulator, partial [Clostridiales bacterium]|nr:MarR family transcriptional regulator [Clostridiales bacterium]
NKFPEGKATLKTLEKYFGVAQSTEAGIAVRLEKKELVTSYTDPDDRRIKIIVITNAGRKICEEAHSNMLNAEHRLLKGLNEEESGQFFALLEKVYNALE